jgi:hypothetical protein
MDPERNIEKWLRRFARQRREQAGQPFELHGADRQKLQAEVRRQYAPRQERRTGWFAFRSRWAMAVVAVAGAAILAATILPSLNQAKLRTRYASTPGERFERAAVAPEIPPAAPSPAAAISAPQQDRERRSEIDDMGSLEDKSNVSTLLDAKGAVLGLNIATDSVQDGRAATAFAEASDLSDGRKRNELTEEPRQRMANLSAATNLPVSSTEFLKATVHAITTNGTRVQLRADSGLVYDGYKVEPAATRGLAGVEVLGAVQEELTTNRFYWFFDRLSDQDTNQTVLRAGAFFFTNANPNSGLTSKSKDSVESAVLGRSFYLLPSGPEGSNSATSMIETGTPYRIRVSPTPLIAP